ncbi:MAG: Cna B-type domain-containing protein, partial [Bacilli bacterium]|nr:Cna B-type domain-containing protein [Bacilli bacterium]
MADGEEVDTKEVKANAEGKWLYSFDELPKYKNVEGKAQEIVYTISEIAPEGYAPSYDIQGNV